MKKLYFLCVHFPVSQFYNIRLNFDKTDLFDKQKLMKLKQEIIKCVNEMYDEDFKDVKECTIMNIME